MNERLEELINKISITLLSNIEKISKTMLICYFLFIRNFKKLVMFAALI